MAKRRINDQQQRRIENLQQKRKDKAEKNQQKHSSDVLHGETLVQSSVVIMSSGKPVKIIRVL